MPKILIELPSRLTAIPESCGRCQLLVIDEDASVDWCMAFHVNIERKHTTSGGIRRLRCVECMNFEKPKVQKVIKFIENVLKNLKREE